MTGGHRYREKASAVLRAVLNETGFREFGPELDLHFLIHLVLLRQIEYTFEHNNV